MGLSIVDGFLSEDMVMEGGYWGWTHNSLSTSIMVVAELATIPMVGTLASSATDKFKVEELLQVSRIHPHHPLFIPISPEKTPDAYRQLRCTPDWKSRSDLSRWPIIRPAQKTLTMSENLSNHQDAWADDSRQIMDSDHQGLEDWEEDLRTGNVHYMRGVSVGTPQSGLGITSLILSIVAGVMIAGSVIAAAILFGPNPNPHQPSPQLLGFGCSLMLGVGLAVLAGILGLLGLFQQDRSKTCAVLGTLLSGLEIFGIVSLTFIGLMGRIPHFVGSHADAVSVAAGDSLAPAGPEGFEGG